MGILQNLQNFRVRYGSVTELTEIPGIVARAYRTHIRYKNDIPVPRVFVALAYRTSRSWFGYGYECPTELTEVVCRVIPGVNTPKVWFVRTLRNPTLEDFRRDSSLQAVCDTPISRFTGCVSSVARIIF